MKTFEEVLENIKNEIEKIKDEDLKRKLQEKYDKIPKDASLFKLKSYSNNTMDVPATLSKEELTEAYKTSVMNHLAGYYGGKNYEEARKKHEFEIKIYGKFILDSYREDLDKLNDKSIEFDCYYECVLEKTNYDKSGLFKNSDYICVRIGTSVISTDFYFLEEINNELNCIDVKKQNRSSKKLDIKKKAGVSKTVDELHYTKSIEQVYAMRNYLLKGIPPRINPIIPEKFIETHAEYGYNENLVGENKIEEKTTSTIDGNIISIEDKKTLEIENESTKVQTKSIKRNKDGTFEKTIKREEIDVVKFEKEIGKLKPGEKLDFSLKGEKVNENLNQSAVKI